MRSALLHKEFSDKLRNKREKYKKWKEGSITRAVYQEIVQICNDRIGKAKVQNELVLAKKMPRITKKLFFDI